MLIECSSFAFFHAVFLPIQKEARSLPKFRVRNACARRSRYSRRDEGKPLSAPFHICITLYHLPHSGIQSDHPVVNSRYLLNEAAMAHFYGLNSGLALASVTSTPAAALGLGHRVGTIREGVTYLSHACRYLSNWY